jgi:hypothetical protein
MEPQKSAEEICEIVAGVMRDFREGMDNSHQLSLRIGRRTTQIIRMGLFSVLALAAAMFYLASILTADFGRITDKMVIMSETMDRNVGGINAAVQNMTGSVQHMTNRVRTISRPMEMFP